MKQRVLYYWPVMIIILILMSGIMTLAKDKEMKYNKLTKEEERVILHKGTERAFTGKFDDFTEKGTYTCKQCDTPLYHSADKFDAHCGWPSFDDEIEGAVKRQLDADGHRTEILCANCGAHLGHVFMGEGFTAKNTRHCVNSISMNFIPEKEQKMETNMETKTAYFAGGCFWGTEYYFQQAKGVKSTTVGYMGGHVDNPTYKQVSYQPTGHAETVKVEYDPGVTDFETLAKLFFEIHDPTQEDRQGPDVGKQYRSVVFYNNPDEKEISEKLINILEKKGFDVATELVKAEMFWDAEDYHQDYYQHNGKEPYCHFYTKRF